MAEVEDIRWIKVAYADTVVTIIVGYTPRYFVVSSPIRSIQTNVATPLTFSAKKAIFVYFEDGSSMTINPAFVVAVGYFS